MLEAMACGTPVAASDTPALREIGGGAALLLDPHSVEDMAQALERIAGDEALRRELRARGLERARAFSWDRCARETLAVLEEVAGEHG
jgi:glycosyltransferase involved in cell wall biosynthesis